MTQSNLSQRVMFVAGEASGDYYAADLVKKLLAQSPNTHCYGMGLAKMRSAGLEMLIDASDLSTMAHHFIAKLPQYIRAYKKLTQILQKDQPDVLVLIDYSEFNLRLAKFAHRLRTKVIYYISPKVWVWRRYRIKKIAKYVDDLVVIHSFEKEIYRHTSLRVHYFGHPLTNDIHLDEVQKIKDNLPKGNAHILLLPGSRLLEIKKHFAILCEAASLLKKQDAHLRFSCVALPAQYNTIRQIMKQYQLNCDLIDNRYSNLARAHFAIACAGTVTLQLALCQTPTLLIYQAATFYRFLEFLGVFGVKHLSLPSLIMQREVMQEIVRSRLSATEICNATLKHIRDPEKMLQMQKDSRQLFAMLMGQADVSQQVVQLILSKINGSTVSQT